MAAESAHPDQIVAIIHEIHHVRAQSCRVLLRRRGVIPMGLAVVGQIRLDHLHRHVGEQSLGDQCGRRALPVRVLAIQEGLLIALKGAGVQCRPIVDEAPDQIRVNGVRCGHEAFGRAQWKVPASVAAARAFSRNDTARPPCRCRAGFGLVPASP